MVTDMKRSMLVLGITMIGLATLALPGPHRNATAQVQPAPLLSCPDVNGDGGVSGLDFFLVLGSFNAMYPDSDYLLLHDVDGGGAISGTDFFKVLADFSLACPELETQVAQATLAVLDYRDQSAALADGYVPVTQNISGHGIHWMKAELLDGVFDLTQPEGLNYSTEGKLLAVYYIDPIWLPGHEEQPAGFAGDEDMWHGHPGLCQWQGPGGPLVAESVSEQDCLSRPGGVWFENFGWMLHIWNFMPNETGRFQMQNDDAG
jgi:Dockerin type I domain